MGKMKDEYLRQLNAKTPCRCEYCKKNNPVSYAEQYDAYLCEDCFCSEEIDEPEFDPEAFRIRWEERD